MTAYVAAVILLGAGLFCLVVVRLVNWLEPLIDRLLCDCPACDPRSTR